MPPEPKKPIEEMLEASAKARRAAFESDPKMPNPMRARLHDEISRLEREGRDDSGKSWMQMFWPRIAVAAAVATLLVVAPVMWWNRSHPYEGTVQLAGRGPMAANEIRETAKSGERSTLNAQRPTSNKPEAVPPEQILTEGPAAAGAAPSVALADSSRAKIETEQMPGSAAESLDETKRTPEVQATPFAMGGQITTDSIAKERQDAKGEKATKTIAAAPAPAAPASPAPVSARDRVASAARSGQARISPAHRQEADATHPRRAIQQFIQQQSELSFRNNSQSAQTAKILNTFQVQQAGTDIRVVDADGSTYTGKLEPTAELVGRTAAKRKQSYAARAETDDKTALPQSRFRASGYNVSLKKPLVFEGNYTVPAAQAQQQLQANDPTQSQEIQERARIIGTARVHGETPVQIDATAVATLPEASATKK